MHPVFKHASLLFNHPTTQPTNRTHRPPARTAASFLARVPSSFEPRNHPPNHPTKPTTRTHRRVLPRTRFHGASRAVVAGRGAAALPTDRVAVAYAVAFAVRRGEAA
eukprot:356129-Chlamydomonas_euryale.AAC.3